jgi:hypothetical protein
LNVVAAWRVSINTLPWKHLSKNKNIFISTSKSKTRILITISKTVHKHRPAAASLAIAAGVVEQDLGVHQDADLVGPAEPLEQSSLA